MLSSEFMKTLKGGNYKNWFKTGTVNESSFHYLCRYEGADTPPEDCPERATVFVEWDYGLKRSLCAKHFEKYSACNRSTEFRIVPATEARMRMALE